ncbi:MAG: hypothetical protein OES25_11880 [Acidobacteriota bacterium]|nr:hypothetical protein [Acidobacteriota bacterium]
MPRHASIDKLVRIAPSFGPTEAAEKLRLLAQIESAPRLTARDLLELHDAICFLRAYPDSPRVLRAVEAAADRLRELHAASGIDVESSQLENRGFPGAVVRDEFSFPALERLQLRYPGCLEIDWDELESQDPLVNALGLCVTSAECQGLDDIGLQLQEWFAACRPTQHRTDLEFLLFLFRNARLGEATRNLIFEGCAVPIRFELASVGTARSENISRVNRVRYQTRPLDRARHAIAPIARREFSSTTRASAKLGEEVIGLGLTALCSRNLEIRTLSNGNANDVTVVDCGRGLRIALIGVLPAYRDPLECHYCMLVFKNGVPIAYGPGTVSLGCCEVGINLFPEFRGAEIRYLYPQFIRTLYQLLGARYFFLTPYGMGEENPAAIRTGAFWFYRKLGFRPTNPKVEELAQEEERRLARKPRERSSPAMLRRLSHTSAYLDLSDGECRPLDLGAIGVSHSRFISESFDGDRQRALQECIPKVARELGLRGVYKLQPDAQHAWAMLAPILAMLPGLPDWSPREKQRMQRILREKGGPSERGVDRLLRGHRTLCHALRTL